MLSKVAASFFLILSFFPPISVSVATLRVRFFGPVSLSLRAFARGGREREEREREREREERAREIYPIAAADKVCVYHQCLSMFAFRKCGAEQNNNQAFHMGGVFFHVHKFSDKPKKLQRKHIAFESCCEFLPHSLSLSLNFRFLVLLLLCASVFSAQFLYL